jgi:predicted anti-sigma-YlaC factor YlaD
MTRNSKRPLAGLAFKLPFMMTCKTFEGFIDDYLDSALSSRQKFVFETHLKLCRECREYLQEYASSIYLAKQQAASPTSDVDLENVPSDLINAILAAKSDSG